MADIYAELRQDHAEHPRLLYDLAEGGGDPQLAFPDAYHRLYAHLGAEQDVLYEELLTVAPARASARSRRSSSTG